MKYRGVVFDFNGTIFWDTALHNKAWDSFLTKYKIKLSDNEKFRTLHGKNNQSIFKTLFGDSISEADYTKFSFEKETIYQDLCKQYLFLISKPLAPGLISLLNFLKSKDIPYTIATASDKFNLDFYFKHLKLSQWFDYDKVIYNDGFIKGKPNPDLYIKAFSALGLEAKDVLVFEDAISGLQAAKNADAANIVIVNSNNDDYTGWKEYQIINNFDQVDRNLFA